MSSFDRKAFVANNPSVAAQFFDAMIRTFIDVVLKHGHGPGLFGACTTYYGMVEAQGKGTLHCHMLIWLEGNPSPQKLRDQMSEDPDFKNRMFQWLEENISSHIPGETEVCHIDPLHPLTKPKYTARMIQEQNLNQYFSDHISDEDFQTIFKEVCS